MMRRLASIPVDTVRVPKDTLRQLDRDWAEVVGRMMVEEGQAQPIEVGAEGGGGYVLVFGLHRLEGAKLAGLKTIDALVDDEGGDLAARRRRAIHENLFRRELSYLDRSVHIAELHADLKAARGERRGGNRRAPADQKADARLFGLAEEIAARVGLSESTVKEAVQIAHGIAPAARHRIVTTPLLVRLADSRIDLARLAAEPDAQQTCILDLLAEEPGSVADAIAYLAGEKRPTETDRHRALAVNALARLTPRDRLQLFDRYEDELKAWARRKGWVR